MRQIVPGVYLQGNDIHIDHEDVCKYLGVPNTPDQIDMVQALLRQVVEEVFPGHPVNVTDVRS